MIRLDYARFRGASSFSRPTRYKSIIKTTNGIIESRSDDGPPKNGLFAVDQCSTRSLLSFQTPAKKAMNTAAKAPPAMYPEAIRTPGLLSVSATNSSSVNSLPFSLVRKYLSTNQRIIPPRKIGLDEDSGR